MQAFLCDNSRDYRAQQIAFLKQHTGRSTNPKSYKAHKGVSFSLLYQMQKCGFQGATRRPYADTGWGKTASIK